MQPLEVELGGDAQVEVAVERVVVGHERPGRGAAVDRLERRRLDLDEAALVEEAAHRGDRRARVMKASRDVRVGHQVEVALAEAGLGVAQRRRACRAAAAAPWPAASASSTATLSSPRRVRATGPVDPDDVAEVEVEQGRHGLLAEAVDASPTAGCARCGRPGRGRRPCPGRGAPPGGRRRAPARRRSRRAPGASLRGRARPRSRRRPGKRCGKGSTPRARSASRLGATLRDQRRETALRTGPVSRCDHPPGCPRSGTGGRRAVPGS